MGTYNNLNKKAKTIVDTGLVLGILSDIGSGLSLIVYETNDALFPKISIKTRGCSKLVSLIRKDGLEFVFNLVLMSSAQNTVGIKAETYGLVGLNTYKFDGKESRLLSTRELTHYYLQEGFEHNLVPLKHSVDVLSKLNVLPDQATDLPHLCSQLLSKQWVSDLWLLKRLETILASYISCRTSSLAWVS